MENLFQRRGRGEHRGKDGARQAAVALLCAAWLLTGCASIVNIIVPSSELQIAGGDPDRGLVLIQEYGCQSCHAIPGLQGRPAWVGPPLEMWSERLYIAGNLTNTPENLIYWLQFPQEVEPGTAMPNQGVTEEDARHISAYLYTLR